MTKTSRETFTHPQSADICTSGKHHKDGATQQHRDSPIPGQGADVVHDVGGGSGTGDPEPLLKNTGLLRKSQT